MTNRTRLGLICIAVALFLSFIAAPYVNKKAIATTSVYTANREIEEGSPLDASMFGLTKINNSALPEGALTSLKEISGAFAAAKIYQGDILTAAKLGNEAYTAERALTQLETGELAVSISIDSFSAGLSGKLQNNDIVSIFVKPKNSTEVFLPPELRYVRVITATDSQGQDADAALQTEDRFLPSTITLKVCYRQALKLVEYEDAFMMAALCTRGNEAKATELLNLQAAELARLEALAARQGTEVGK